MQPAGKTMLQSSQFVHVPTHEEQVLKQDSTMVTKFANGANPGDL
jgi:hypothetical protein